MTINYVNLETWYINYEEMASKGTNQRQQQLGQIRQVLKEGRSSQIYLEYCEQGKKVSTSLNEPYWYLYFAVSHTEGRIATTKSRSERLKLATQLYVESNKSQYDGCPYRAHSYAILLDQYTLNDPVGYADLIQQGIEYCYQNFDLTPKLHHQLLDVQVKLDIALENWDDAENSALHFQSIFDNYVPVTLHTSLYLCEIAYKKRDPKKLSQYIDSAKNSLRHDTKQQDRISILYWQAILARLQNKSGVSALKVDQELQKSLQNLSTITPEIGVLQFYYAIETNQLHLPDSLISPLKYDTLGKYYRAVAALRFLYAYRRASARAQGNIIIPYTMMRLKNTSKVQQIINFITTPLPYIGEQRKNSSSPITQFIWTIIYLLIFIPYIPIFIIMAPIARLLIKPDAEVPKFINGLLKDSKSLPIFQDHLQTMMNNPNYIP